MKMALSKISCITAITLFATACTLHPPTDKHQACLQAERQSAYNNAARVGEPAAASQNAQLQQTMRTNC